MDNKKIRAKTNKIQKNPSREKKHIGEAGTRRLVIVFICVFLGVSILFGASLGIVFAIKRSSYIFYYEGVGLDEGLVNYFGSYYKTIYMKANSIVGTKDKPEFWNEKKEGDDSEITNGDDLRRYTEIWIKNLVAANVIYDKEYSLSLDDKEQINNAMTDVFEGLGVENKSEFNDEVKDFGFDYKDFERASEMLYKEKMLAVKKYGSDLSGIAADSNACFEFMNNYSRVKFIFIRTENTFKRDENGNKVIENNSNSMITLTEEQKNERFEYIEKLKSCINGINAGTTDSDGFDGYAKEIGDKYLEITSEEISGYYLYKKSRFTRSFEKDFASVATVALALSEGEGAYIELKKETDHFDGYCFMYRDAVNPLAYIDTSENGFFADFYSFVATEKCNDEIDKKNDFEAKESWSYIDISAMPYMKTIHNYVAQF